MCVCNIDMLVVYGASMYKQRVTHLCTPETVPVRVPIPASATAAAAAAVAHPVVLAPDVTGVVATVLLLFLGRYLGSALT